MGINVYPDPLDGKAPLNSPALTGTPSGPTAASGSNNTQLATTAYADRNIGVDVSLGSVSGAISLTSYVAQNQAFELTATGNLTFDGSAGKPAIVAGMAPSILLKITQDATGGRTITWSNVKWSGGAAGGTSSAANAIDIFAFTWIGGVCYASVVGKAFA